MIGTCPTGRTRTPPPSGTDEADMAINTRYTWTTGCTAQPGAFDLEY